MNKKYLVSIDPSINFLGYAVFENKELIEYDLLKSKVREDHYLDKCREMVKSIIDICEYTSQELFPWNDLQIVTEIPQHFGSGAERGYLARESGSVFKLTFLCGMIYNIKNNVVSYEPRQWKGQLPKDVVARRLQKHYLKIKIFSKDKFILDHNICDAIAIGHFHLWGKL